MSTYDDEPALEVVPDETDLSEMVDATARNAAAPIGPPTPIYPGWVPPAEELSDEDSWEPDADVPGPAQPELARTTVTDDGPDAAVQEAAVFKSEMHPRWPKGSGKKAGEFMEVGQTFMSGGKRWEISHIVHGHIYAHEASGDYHQSEHKSFDVAHEAESGHQTVHGVEYAEPKSVPQGGKSGSNVPVIDPYVDSSTHDPSIPIPAQSQISADQWKRFGKADQQHYVELMERFGKHKPGAAKAHVDASYAKYSAKVQQMVKEGYSAQYGSSSGYTLSLASDKKGGHAYGAIPNTPEYAKLREEALALQAEHKAAVQWDLYNRTRSPDLFVVHKSKHWSSDQWHKHAIAGNNPVFSGLSQSFCYRRGFFGNDGIATPLAIRHVLMSTKSAQPVPVSSFISSELEIAVPHQLKADDRSIVLSAVGNKGALTPTQMKWLEGITNQPQGGHIMEQLRDAMENGTHLPVPPAAPNVTMDGAGGKTWADPPGEAASSGFAADWPDNQSAAVDPKTLDKDLPWQHHDAEGNPKPVTGEDAGAQAGQYFMGLKGTLYWIGNDPGVGGGYPFRIHKIVNGKFNGENYPYNPDLPGYYLKAQHEEVLPSAEGPAPFSHDAYVQSTDSKFLEQFKPGEKFKLNGTPYEVTGTGYSGSMKVTDLESGLTGQINGDYKSTWLVPYGGGEGVSAEQVATGGPSFNVGDHVVAPDYKGVVTEVSEADGTVHVQPFGSTESLGENPSALTKVGAPGPKVGMTVAMRRPGAGLDEPKVKATVTKVMANGDVQLNLKPGKVLLPKDEWSAHAINAYDPGAHTIGEKVKLRDLKPGDKFHASAGNQTHRPYEVVQQLDGKGGKKTTVRNLDTGEVTTMSAHKSYPTLDEQKADAPSAGVPSQATPGVVSEGSVGPAWDPAKYELSGQTATVAEMPVGSLWQSDSGTVYKKTADTGEESEVTTVHVGSENYHGVAGDTIKVEHSLPLSQVALLKPKDDPAQDATPDGAMAADAATGFDPSKYIEGGKQKIGNLPGGTIFKTDSKAGPKYYQLSEDGSHTTNLQTGKVYEAKPHFKATPMAFNGPAEEPAPSAGDPTLTYPAGSTVFFNPHTKETGLDHATVIGYDPQSKNLAVNSPLTNTTIFVGTHEVGSVIPLEDHVNAQQQAPGTLMMNNIGDVYQKVDGKPGEAKLVKKGEANTSGQKIGDVAMLGSADKYWAVVGPREQNLLGVHPVGEDEPHAGNVAAMKSGGHTATVEVLPNGKKRYRLNGEVHHKASSADYTHVTLWQNDNGTVAPGFHKSPAAAHKATEGPSGSKDKIATIAVTPHDPEAGGPTVAMHELKVGDKYQQTPGSGIGQVVKNENGELYVKSAAVIGDVKGVPVPKQYHNMQVHLVPDAPDVGEEKPGNAKTKNPLGTNKQGMTFGEMPVGTVFSPGAGGMKYKKTGEVDADGMGMATGASAYNQGEALPFGADHVPDDLHALPTEASVGKLATVKPDPNLPPSLAWQGSQTGYVTKVRPADGAVQVDSGLKWHKPEHTQLHENFPPISGGDTVISEDGNKGTFVKWDTHPNGDLSAVVDTTGNYDLEHWPPQQITGIDVGTGFEQSGTPLIDKAFVPTPYDQLSVGDTTTLETLQHGDLLKVPGVDEVYKVISKPAPNANYEDQYHTLAPNLGGDNWGTPFTSVLPASEPVTFHAKAGEFVPAEHPPAALEPEDHPDALEHGFTPFSSPQGGPYVHSQIASMPQGTVFEDAAGNVWKVKQGGPTPIISGGPHHYKVDGALRGKDLSQPGTQTPQHLDTAGPVGGGAEPDAQMAAAEHELVDNVNGITLAQMNLKPGDVVKFKQGTSYSPHEFVQSHDAAPNGSYVFTNLNTGAMVYKGGSLSPHQASPSAYVGTSPPNADVLPDNEPPSTLYSEAKPLGALGPGEKFTHAPGSAHVHEVVHHSPTGGTVTVKGPEGAAQHPSDHPVYVMPKPDDTLSGPSLPAKPEADPATLPPVEGPNGFAPEQPKPVLDPNWETAPPGGWDPFTHRKGGIYTYPKLGETQPGQLMTDKSGNDYRVVDHGSATTVIEDVASGKQYGVDSGHRVKLTALPPDPGPELKPIVQDLTVKHGSLENVPKLDLNGHQSTYASDGKTKNPRLINLGYGEVAYDADGHKITMLGSWLDRALVLDHATNTPRLADAATRVTKAK